MNAKLLYNRNSYIMPEWCSFDLISNLNYSPKCMYLTSATTP